MIKLKPKYENIIIVVYSIITYLKYAVSYNPNVIELLISNMLDVLLGIAIYYGIIEIKKELKSDRDQA